MEVYLTTQCKLVDSIANMCVISPFEYNYGQPSTSYMVITLHAVAYHCPCISAKVFACVNILSTSVCYGKSKSVFCCV